MEKNSRSYLRLWGRVVDLAQLERQGPEERPLTAGGLWPAGCLLQDLRLVTIAAGMGRIVPRRAHAVADHQVTHDVRTRQVDFIHRWCIPLSSVKASPEVKQS